MKEKFEKKSIESEISFNEETGIFEGYASTFGNMDHGKDIVVKGAFKDVLEKTSISDIDMLFDHNKNEVIGEWLEMREDDHGLFVRGRLWVDKIQKAGEVHFLMLKNKIKHMSIGFVAPVKKIRGKVRLLKRFLRIPEISVVRDPMNGHAGITGVKSMKIEEIEEVKSLSDVEDLLKELGLSNKGAEALISKVTEFKKISEKGEPSAEEKAKAQADLETKRKEEEAEKARIEQEQKKKDQEETEKKELSEIGEKLDEILGICKSEEGK